MQLKDFITTVIVDIEQGVNSASHQVGKPVFLKNISTTGDEGIDFDVAVTAASEASGKVGAEVFSVGAKAEGKLSNEQVSRIKFKINVGFPFKK